MKHIKFFALVVVFLMLLTLAACSGKTASGNITASPSHALGQIYLYGEAHSVSKIQDKEFALWEDDYHNKNMRHLFIEMPYYTAEFLNVWMKSDSDVILEDIYEDWKGTQAYNPNVKEFFKKIKKACPETIFHGTDVGHQYETTGVRYLKYLEDNKLEGSKQYSLAQEDIKQGEYYYGHQDEVYRENKMAENFIREFDILSDKDVMGIYGEAHAGLDAMDYSTKSVPCMANQLKAHYGDAIHSEDLSWLAKDIKPDRTDIIKINQKDYKASHFGKEDMTAINKEYVSREFWRLENAYDDFKNNPKTLDVLPYNNYPMLIEKGQVFAIDYTKADGSVIRMYYRSDGDVWNGQPSTSGFKIK